MNSRCFYLVWMLMQQFVEESFCLVPKLSHKCMQRVDVFFSSATYSVFRRILELSALNTLLQMSSCVTGIAPLFEMHKSDKLSRNRDSQSFIFFRTSLTKVSISAALICFSNSFLLLCNKAVMVSSAKISRPICSCMNPRCFAVRKGTKICQQFWCISDSNTITNSGPFLIKLSMQ